jgi:drug/metabolite transporter (DMT)-like permease
MTPKSVSPQDSPGEGTAAQIPPASPQDGRPAPRPTGGRHAKTYVAVVLITLAGPVGNVLLASGMQKIGKVTFQSPAQVFELFLRVFATPTIWLGIASLITFFVMYMLALSWADYSFVQPATSLAYGVVALLGYFALDETISPLRWLGIAIICLGVFLVGRTDPQTTERS